MSLMLKKEEGINPFGLSWILHLMTSSILFAVEDSEVILVVQTTCKSGNNALMNVISACFTR